jgi:lysophospholipase L1-like esterase
LDIQNLLGRTEIYRFIRGLILSRFQAKKTGNSSEILPRVSPQDFLNNLLEMALIASQENIPVIFLTSPIASLEAFWGPGKGSKTHQWHQVYNNVILNLPLSDNAYIFDAAALFENRKDVYDKPQDDFIHYNTTGHKLIAENLYNFLEQNKLIFKQPVLTLK